MDQKIDIFITTYLRQDFAKECVKYLVERTKTPYRLTILDNGGNEWAEGNPDVQRYIPLHRVFGNTGIHFAWNVAAALADGKYFITSDPDLLVPDLVGATTTVQGARKDLVFVRGYDAEGNESDTTAMTDQRDWLQRMVDLMEEHSDFGAISMMPHIFIGAAGIDPHDPEDLKDRNMCGAVFRIMDTDKVRSVGGWDLRIEAGRNHEERTICSRLHAAGYKTGIASRVRAYHNFGKNWGYPESFTPEQQKHNPALAEEILRFDNREAYNNKTWLPK